MPTSLKIPKKLEHLAKTESGPEWIASLPSLLAELSHAWSLTVGSPYQASSVSYTAPAEQGGLPVVLKIQWPHDECVYEMDALRCWDGVGAVQLLGHDRDKHALLLERCVPGNSIGDSALHDKISPIISLLPTLWVKAPAHINTLSSEARKWQKNLLIHWEQAGRPIERRLIDKASDYIDELVNTQGEAVLLHQDLHGDNILASQRKPWLAIDPKPLSGEREFSVAPIVRSAELGQSHQAVMQRLDRICAACGLNRERARKWTIVQSIAWGMEGGPQPHHLRVARWLEDAASY